jgi:hypothetical protein
MSGSEVYAQRGAGATFLDALAVSSGIVLGLTLPAAALYGAAWVADQVDEWRRGRPVPIEVRMDDLPAYHLALLTPGETSTLPPNALGDFRKAQKVSVRRRP